VTKGWAIRSIAPGAVVAIAVAGASLAVAALEAALGVPSAASVYLVAVVVVAVAVGTRAAALAAVLSVAAYDFFFTDPRFTLVVSDPGEWLDLVLLLFVAVTVGELAALQRRRADSASAREREARSLGELTRALATRESTRAVLPAILGTLARAAMLERAWVALGGDDATERVVADTTAGPPLRHGGTYTTLQRGPGADAPRWAQVRSPVDPPVPGLGERRYRVRLEADGQPLGSIWATRPVDAGPPDAAGTRLLAAAADQVAQALDHDRLADEAKQAEVARQSDVLKSALLASVSHDLRTPLASIRAYAGTLMDEEVRLDPLEARSSAAAIDREAQRLNRIVTNLLDLGRIEGGALRPSLEVLDVDDVVAGARAHAEPGIERRTLAVTIGPGTMVLADPVLLDEVLVNLLDNVVRHTPEGTLVRVGARNLDDGSIRLTVEDAGPGVPPAALPHLFDTFYRVPRAGGPGSRGTGIGLAVVRGLVAALGGTVRARDSQLGGLAVDLDLPAPSRMRGEEEHGDDG
jgi:two-component system sensor histidine kinase KdpD